MLKVGSDTTSPPMESVDPATGQIVGFDVDVVNAICAKINCKAEFVTTGWDGIFAALEQGNFDLVASGVSITDERKKAMDFSEPYIINSQAVLMRAEDDGLTLDDFKSKGKSCRPRRIRPTLRWPKALSARIMLLPTTVSAPLSSRLRIRMSTAW